MSTPMRHALAFLLLAGLACGGGSGATLQVPDASEVDAAQIATEGSPTLLLKEAAALSRVLGHLEGLAASGDWEASADELPPTSTSIALSSRETGVRLVLWLSDDWLTGNDMQGNLNLRRRLSAEERTELLQALGSPTDQRP